MFRSVEKGSRNMKTTSTSTSSSSDAQLPSRPRFSGLSWSTRMALKIVSKLNEAAFRSDGTVNRRLLNLIDFKAPPNSSDVTSSDVVVDPARNLWFRLFVPHQSIPSSLPVVVYFHGGGFVKYSPSSVPFDSLCRNLAAKIPAVVVSVNYRTAPEHRWPSQYVDGFDVVSFLDGGAALPENADRTRLFLAGDSAGGNVAHHVALRLCREIPRRLNLTRLILIMPFFGGEERTESEIRLKNDDMLSLAQSDRYWKAFLPEGSTRDHEAANVSGPRAVALSEIEFPSTVVFVGNEDPLQDWQRRYYEWLRKSGVKAKLIEFRGMFHGFYCFRELAESEELVSGVRDFVAGCTIQA